MTAPDESTASRQLKMNEEEERSLMMGSPKKRILITAMSMNIGGAEKSLVNLLNLLDYSRLDVDLLLFQRRGEFLSQIPSATHVISVPEIDVLYGIKPQGKLGFLRRSFLTVARYVTTGITYSLEKQFDRRRLNRWRNFYSHLIPRMTGNYDYAVSYAGGETFWYVVEKVAARKKAVFFHSDYSNIDIDVAGENAFLDSADLIVTISEKCADSLRALFPGQSDKVRVMQNPSCVKLVRRQAAVHVNDGFLSAEPVLRIVSVGRLDPVKGFDLAAQAAVKLFKEFGPAFEWIIVGGGAEQSAIQSIIDEGRAGEVFRLIGPKLNPYPYIAEADLVVQSSRFEGKSVVLDEARVLGKPVLVTDYPSACDQVRDGIDGMLVPIDSDGIAAGIARLIKDRSLTQNLAEGSRQRDVSQLEDVSAFMRLIDVPAEEGGRA